MSVTTKTELSTQPSPKGNPADCDVRLDPTPGDQTHSRINHPASQLRTTIKSLDQSIKDMNDASFYTSKAEVDKEKMDGCQILQG
ncbi:hypothetical protein N7530_012261 [Penicillium desertorum]|uniref:Uncharacterized protein n=1 Tax=Penicillium desertorum TaxID=1303715 RepID=A0A9X0BGE5_9EURO|nr:hypothetical protein N7530_012261 [Penicillium desertorum]